MSNLAIRVETLSKQYQIGGSQKTYNRLSDQIADFVVSPFRRAGKILQGQFSGAAELDVTIWALKDVSLEVNHGETVGIIGPNGAGKTTLLKILSRITAPTEGRVEIYGRIGSLLEVGTGFHPELTGRENILLNGTILGMKKREIDRKFDEIVDFAEIEKFIDTPVKHYSSGMYVRLAFSVAAHLEPEILIVDEVLAVGDIAFQKKCLGKMDAVAQEGRTVLFVSHNMGLVQSLCQRGIYLNDGVLVCDDTIKSTVAAYLKTLENSSLSQHLSDRKDRQGLGHTKIIQIEIDNCENCSTSPIMTGQLIKFVFHVSRILPLMSLTFSIYDHLGQPVVEFNSRNRGPQDLIKSTNELTFICEIDRLLLLPGRYRVDAWLAGDNNFQDGIRNALTFDVVESQINGRPVAVQKQFRVFFPHRWLSPN